MEKVAIFLADGFEEIEGLAVVDLLRRADIPIEMVSITDRLSVLGSHLISVQADCIFKDWNEEDTDMLVLPGGGIGTNNLRLNENVIALVKRFFSQGKMLAAICAAPSIFGQCGILQGKKATSYPSFRDQLKGARVLDEKVVKDGTIITSKGMGTSLDFGLEIIAHYKGKEAAEGIKDSIQYESATVYNYESATVYNPVL